MKKRQRRAESMKKKVCLSLSEVQGVKVKTRTQACCYTCHPLECLFLTLICSYSAKRPLSTTLLYLTPSVLDLVSSSALVYSLVFSRIVAF